MSIVAILVFAGLSLPPGLASAPGISALASPANSAVAISASGNPVHPVRHVVVIVLENHDITQVWNPSQGAGYLRYLSATYGNATSFYSACHPSAPNYLALTSGRTLPCGSDGFHRLRI
jgi:hypothetical protein